MNISDPIVERSYRFCRHVAKRSGSSFYPCFFVLSVPRRRAMEAIYAFMRHADDLGDRPGESESSRRAKLQAWRESLDRVLQGESVSPSSADAAEWLLPAVADAVRRFHIPADHFHAVIDGVAWDVEGRRYETFDELAEYCHRVASAVGLACIHVWGFHGESAGEAACHCGLAVQLTNILRDLKEDAAMGRVYLPEEDLRRCGYSVEQLRRGEANAAFFELMQLEIARAEAFYDAAERLFDHLDRSGQRIFGLMLAVYRRVLRKIARDPAAVFAGRVRLGRGERLAILARGIIAPRPARRARK